MRSSITSKLKVSLGVPSEEGLEVLQSVEPHRPANLLLSSRSPKLLTVLVAQFPHQLEGI